MEAWARSRLDDARFKMLASLEDNVEKCGAGGPERVFALTALKLCRNVWSELVESLPSATQTQADPLLCPQQHFDNMVRMNITLRSQLKEANRVARSVYRTVLGPISSSARTEETVFSALDIGVRYLRREMFVVQHEQDEQESELDELSFSIRDFLQLADFKMSHAAKRIFEVETNAAGTDGSGIDWEFRVQELTRDLRAQLSRVTRQSETDKAQAAETARTLRAEAHALRQENAESLLSMQRECDKRIKEFKEAFQMDIRDLGDELARRLQDLQIAFVYKIGEQREIDAEGKAVSIRSLQQCLAAERAKIEAKANEIASDPDASLGRQVARYAGDTAVYEDPEDVHQNWEGETHETLVRLLKGKRAELDMMQRSNNVQNRLKNMEWETNLREVMKQYEEEIARLREKMKHLEAEVEHAAKLVTVRMQETAEARAEAQRMQRQLQDDMHRQKLKYDAEIAAVNQELIQVTQQFAKTAQTASNQDKQISDMNAYKNELVGELDEAHDMIKQLKEQMVDMRKSAETDDASTQTDQTSKGTSKSAYVAIQQALRGGKGRTVMSAGSSNASEARSDERKHDGSSDDTVSPQPPQTVHSRRESLANQYTAQTHRTGAKKMRQFFDDGPLTPGSSPPLSPQPGGIIPAPLTVAKAKRRINTVSMASGQQDGGQQDEDLEADQVPSSPQQRRKSKFSAWYEVKQKQMVEESSRANDYGSNGRMPASSPTSQHPPQSSSTAPWLGETDRSNTTSLTTDDQHVEWISDKLNPDYLSRLFMPDPIDAKVLTDDFVGPPQPGGSPGSTLPNIGSGFAILTTEDATARLINEPNFHRLVCKLAVAVEFASAAPSQHTQSLTIKRIAALLPSSVSLLNTSHVAPVVLLDIVCVSQFLGTFWLPRIEKIRVHAHAAEGPWQTKDAYNNLVLVLQKLRDLGSPASIEDVSIEDIQEYVANTASVPSRRSATSAQPRPAPPSSSRLSGRPTPGRTASPTTQVSSSRWNRVVQAVDIKPLMTPLVQVMGFMMASGRLVADLPAVMPDGMSSKPPGSPVGPTPHEVESASPSPPPLLIRANHTGEIREAMMIVSNVPTTHTRSHQHARNPISHLVDAQTVQSQTNLLKRASEAAIKRRGLVSAATAGGQLLGSTKKQQAPQMMLEGTRSIQSAR